METFWDTALGEWGRDRSAAPAQVVFLADVVMSVRGRV